MKRILITGADSYIGTSFEKWMKQYDGYEINTVDMIGDSWERVDFSQYDIVFHVAGIAHRKETNKNAHLYYEINRDLAIKTAKRAKQEKVGQFILLSSMSVYGKTIGNIDKNTKTDPVNNYGKSKLEADSVIEQMNCDSFKTAIVRPPMVYGRNCKGNYQVLSRLAKKTPVFIKTNNKRSMIYINNLCEFIYQLIIHNSHGIFMPQNVEYVSTDDMVKKIGSCHGKKIKIIYGIGTILRFIPIKTFDKIFGSLTYEMQDYGFKYNAVSDFGQSIKESEI